MTSEYTYAKYNGKTDSEFNAALFVSLVSQYSDYTDPKNAERAVREFMPDTKVLDEAAGYSENHSLALIHKNKIIALTCIVPLPDFCGHLISTMEVLEQYRGKGYGSKLLSKAAESKIPCTVYVSIHRLRVKDFYSKLGYLEQQKTKENLYGIEMEFFLMSRI